MWRASLGLILFLATTPALAQTSEYTKIDFEKTCTIVNEYEQGLNAVCAGYTGYPVIFSEGDLRQMVRFGHISKLDGQWESFGEFNRVNDTVEWRLKDKKPYAAILRWFVENSDNSGSVQKELEGNVLVVSTVGTYENPVSCVVGYIDARLHKQANLMTQNLADEKAENFKCGKDKSEFFGKRGKYAGSPTNYFE